MLPIDDYHKAAQELATTPLLVNPTQLTAVGAIAALAFTVPVMRPAPIPILDAIFNKIIRFHINRKF